MYRTNELFPMLFNEVFNNVNDGWNQNFARDPQINISENKKNFKIEFSVPGLSKEDLNLTIDTDNNLVVEMDRQKREQPKAEGETKVEDKNEQYHYLRRDFHLAHFKESISLPDNVHRDQISAKVENGILRIFLPKVTEEEQAKLAQTITIE